MVTPDEHSASADRVYTFSLPDSLMSRVDECLARFRESGLMVHRDQVVQLLLTRGLEAVMGASGVSGPDTPGQGQSITEQAPLSEGASPSSTIVSRKPKRVA